MLTFLLELSAFYKKNLYNRWLCKNEKELAQVVLSFLRKIQCKMDCLIEFEYALDTKQGNIRTGDIRVTFDNDIYVLQVMVVHSSISFDHDKKSWICKNKKRQNIRQDTLDIAYMTKTHFPHMTVTPICVTDEKLVFLDQL
jgi:hypothetical protein